MIDGGNLYRPCKTGEGSAQQEGEHAVLPGWNAHQQGGLRVFTDRLQAQAEMSAAQQEIGKDNDQDSNAKRPGAEHYTW